MYRFIHTCAARTGADKVGDVDAETREYFEALSGAIDTIQGEIITMRGEMGSIRDEIGSMRGEMSAMRDEMGSMRGEMSAIRGGMAAGFVAVDQRFEAFDAKIDRTAADTRRHFEVTVEGIGHQMQILAEGVVMNAEALNRFRTEFIAEIHELRRGR